ncbi:MAG TPA: hypothetical protein VFZ28_03870 [Burkholderiaceae bacterium]|nr:hypothetical protein [Burkholderiaceae bacterium]
MPAHAVQHGDAVAPAVAGGADLDAALLRVEQHLDGLQTALGARDMPGIEEHAAALHQALPRAVEGFAVAARSGVVPSTLRQRLGMVGAQVAAQRDAIARAATGLDRAIDVLMPDSNAMLYSHSGTAQPRRGSTSALQA